MLHRSTPYSARRSNQMLPARVHPDPERRFRGVRGCASKSMQDRASRLGFELTQKNSRVQRLASPLLRLVLVVIIGGRRGRRDLVLGCTDVVIGWIEARVRRSLRRPGFSTLLRGSELPSGCERETGVVGIGTSVILEQVEVQHWLNR